MRIQPSTFKKQLRLPAIQKAAVPKYSEVRTQESEPPIIAVVLLPKENIYATTKNGFKIANSISRGQSNKFTVD